MCFKNLLAFNLLINQWFPHYECINYCYKLAVMLVLKMIVKKEPRVAKNLHGGVVY